MEKMNMGGDFVANKFLSVASYKPGRLLKSFSPTSLPSLKTFYSSIQFDQYLHTIMQFVVGFSSGYSVAALRTPKKTNSV